MPFFSYRARDMRGLLVTGETEAVGPEELKDQLAERGLIPLGVKPVFSILDTLFLKKIFRQRVKGEELLVMTRQFYTLFKAGMDMEAVLGTLVKQTANKRLREALMRIQFSISTGESLSRAFANHPDIFSNLYISLLAAGEEAGILEEVLANLCGLLEKEIELKSALKSSTLYPKIVISVLVAASAVIMAVVVPKFTTFYGHYKMELPFPTRILMEFSHLITHYGYLLLIAAATLWGLFGRYARSARGRIKIGALRFRLPVFGPLNLKVANSRFAHILAALYRSGLPMTRCLEIVGETIDNGAFAREIDILKSEATHGKTISEGMASCRYFTPVIIDATAVGEKTGALDEMLDNMSAHYDFEIQHTLKNLTTLLEPILLIVLFGMITLFTLAIFLPIWNLSRVVTSH